MNRTLALIWKDAREARATLLTLVPFVSIISLLVVAGSRAQRVETSPLDPLRGLALFFIPTVALAMSHVVVTRELTGKTQIFLESLPVRRPHWLACKLFVVVAGVSLAAAAIMLGTLVADCAPGVRMVMALRLFAFSTCMAGIFFLFGFLGRYRVPFALAFAIAFGVLAAGKSFDPGRTAPFGLVLEDTFAREGEHVPWPMIGVALGIAGLCILGALVLALWREGDIASRMAEKMSQREKVFVALAVFGFIVAWSALDEKTEKPPYTLPGAAVANEGGVDVEVGSGAATGDGSDDDRVLAAIVHDALIAAHDVTGLHFTRVIVVSSFDAPEGIVQQASIDDADGIMLRVRPSTTSTSWARTKERVIAIATWLAVAHATEHRTSKEERKWAFDGVGLLMARRDHIDGPLELDDDLNVLAVAAAPDGPDAAMLERWYTFYERVGDEASEAFSYFGLRALGHRVGAEKLRAFLRASLGPRIPRDVRALWKTPRIDDALVSTCGITRAQWIAAWKEEHAAARTRLATKLAALPHVDGHVRFEKLSPLTSKATVALAPDGAALQEGTRVELQSIRLDLDRDLVAEDYALREERDADEYAAGVAVPFSLTSGDRFAWRLVVVMDGGVRVPAPWHREVTP